MRHFLEGMPMMFVAGAALVVLSVNWRAKTRIWKCRTGPDMVKSWCDRPSEKPIPIGFFTCPKMSMKTHHLAPMGENLIVTRRRCA